MRIHRSVPVLPSTGSLLVWLLGAAMAPACAQVTTSQGALDSLGAQAPARHAAAKAGHHAAQAGHHAAARRSGSSSSGRAAPARTQAASFPRPPAATIPPAPPPPPVFRAPVINVPLHPPPPPPPVAVVQTATGSVTPIPGGVRIGFGAGSADVNPTTMQALHDFAARMKADPAVRADLDATSGGSADDPSTPRRLALSRGLAARAVLINDGIASTRIYVRVMGTAPAGGGSAPGASAAPQQNASASTNLPAPASPDRVDMVLSPIPGSDTTIPAPMPAAKGSGP